MVIVVPTRVSGNCTATVPFNRSLGLAPAPAICRPNFNALKSVIDNYHIEEELSEYSHKL